MIIDAHLHLWKKQSGCVNGKPVFALSGGKSDFGGAIRQMMPPYMLDGSNTVEMLIANMDYARVSGCVVTQEYIDGNQDAYLLECRKKYPERIKICCLYEEKEIDDKWIEQFDGIKICAGRLKDSPAEFQGDINAIKFIAYSSQGDCHDLFFKYAGDIKITDYYYTNSDGEKRNCFNLESMSMRLNIEAIRDDKSGYRTFFHESGHNIDALIGKEKTGENNYYTSTKLADGKFHDVIYKEVEGIVVNVVNDYSDNENKLSDGDKALITDVLMGRKHESEIKNSSVDFAYRKISEDITGAWKGKYSRQYQAGNETGILENVNARMLSEVMNGMTNNSVMVDSYNSNFLIDHGTPGHPINWQNPDPNAGYVPQDYYYNADGSYTGFAETEFMAEYMRINMTKSNDEKTYVKSYLRNSWDTLEDELKSDVLMQN